MGVVNKSVAPSCTATHMNMEYVMFNVEIIAVFLWDQQKELGFVYIPTYLAW